MNIVTIPEAEITKAKDLLARIEKLEVTTDETAKAMAINTVEAARTNKEITGLFKEAVAKANAVHKDLTKQRGAISSDASTAEATGRLKIEGWANDVYQLAVEAADDGDIPVRLFPEMDGVTLGPKLMPRVISASTFLIWCMETGNMHFVKFDETAINKYVNAAGTPVRNIPGLEVKTEFTATVRTGK